MAEIEKTGKCSLCNGKYNNYGHNPQPLKDIDERCCDTCNTTKVVPARLVEVSNKMISIKSKMKILRPIKKYGDSYVIKLRPTDLSDFNLEEGTDVNLANILLK